MSDNVFRTITTQPEPAQPKPVEGGDDSFSTDARETDIEPREIGDGAVLEALGIGDSPEIMPSEDRANLIEVEHYVADTLKGKGITPTLPNIKKAIDGMREDIGLEDESDPSLVLERLGGVIKSWKNLSFIKNPAEKRSIFMKLARAQSSEQMNKIIFQEMERREVWN